ncbi:hypothetical protein Golob_024185 [Gossypium lobatum]|uniref:Uncharacterized protein n=1 Tax=Gossypium lobatum TaxID=34289 RepID=A0A7J8NG12_9ROSI|nr:hypothetical protein [Gossypium lobatum]
MGKKRDMVQSKDLDFSTVKYEHEVIKAPHSTGLVLKLLVRMVEAPVIEKFFGRTFSREFNGEFHVLVIMQMLQNTVIPAAPVF